MNTVPKESIPNFETAILADFEFGDPEAKTDEMLASCFQRIRGVDEFLRGSKNIVLGERGAGKSALFKLVSQGSLSFKQEEKDRQRKHMIIPIDDDLEYLAIANVIEERFSDCSKLQHGKHRFLWEVYVLSRVVDQLQDTHQDDIEISSLRNDFGAVLGLPRQPNFRLRDLFTAYKLTVGSKIDPSGAMTPSLSIEPAKETNPETTRVTDHEIAQLRDRLRKALRARNTVAIVLVDRVDDFVVGAAHEEQLKNIQALIDCIKEFRLPELKLKVFLRTDLFKRINFAHGGYDKLAPQLAYLEWSSKDICEFAARRLAHNYKRLGLKVPFNPLDLSLLDIDPTFAEALRDIFRVKNKCLKDVAKAFYWAVKIKISRFRKKSHTARRTDLLDAVILSIITFIFPARIDHFKANCQKDELPLENFLATHFKLGADNPNPRLVLLFLMFTFEQSVHYYSRNPDKESIPANDLNEYELILKEHILIGYRRLQETARQTVAHLDPEYRKFIERMFAHLDLPVKSCGLDLNAIKTATNWDLSDDEMRRFVAFFTHIGLLVPDNETLAFDKRKFSFPLVMQKCPTPI